MSWVARSVRGATGSIVALAFVLAIFAPAPAAPAETVRCKAISRVPTVISRPGVYCLKKDLERALSSGAAIEIQSSDVTLDFNGLGIDASGAGTATDATGVRISDVSRVVVRNGRLVGFRNGVVSVGLGYSIRIEDMTIDGSLERGIDASGLGGVEIRGNRITRTGGSTAGDAGDVYGIFCQPTSDARVVGNEVANTAAAPGGFASYAIRMTGNASVVADNRVTESAENAIYSSNNTAAVLERNTISNASVGAGTLGLRFNAGGVGVYRDNTVVQFQTTVSGGTDGGGNVFAP